MGRPINIVNHGEYIAFSLTNRNNKSKEDLRILIDTEDFYQLVDGVTYWHIHIKTDDNTKKYVRHNSKSIHLHREVYALKNFLPEYSTGASDYVVDHIEGNALDNRSSQLRVLTNLDNMHTKANRSHGIYYRGFSINKTSYNFQVYRKGKYISSRVCIKKLKARLDEIILMENR